MGTKKDVIEEQEVVEAVEAVEAVEEQKSLTPTQKARKTELLIKMSTGELSDSELLEFSAIMRLEQRNRGLRVSKAGDGYANPMKQYAKDNLSIYAECFELPELVEFYADNNIKISDQAKHTYIAKAITLHILSNGNGETFTALTEVGKTWLRLAKGSNAYAISRAIVECVRTKIIELEEPLSFTLEQVNGLLNSEQQF